MPNRRTHLLICCFNSSFDYAFVYVMKTTERLRPSVRYFEKKIRDVFVVVVVVDVAEGERTEIIKEKNEMLMYWLSQTGKLIKPTENLIALSLFLYR